MRKEEGPVSSRVEVGPGAAPRGTGVTQLCSWCGRVQRGGEWVALEADAPKPVVSHGVCPDCFERVLRRERERG
jgi:hypothetical protein